MMLSHGIQTSIMSITQLPLTLDRRHHNRHLFADRYLDVTLPQRAAWLALRDEAAPILVQIRALLAAFTPSTNEARTERELVRPALEALGHSFEIRTPLRTPAGTKKPDDFFYRDQAALSANEDKALTDGALAAAFAVGDARRRERRLDVTLAGAGEAISHVPARGIAFSMLHSATDFIEEMQKRRLRAAGKLTLAGLALRDGYAEQAPPRMLPGRG